MKTKLEAMQTTAAQAETVKPCPKALQAKFDAKPIGRRVARHGDLWLVKAAGLPAGAERLDGNVLLRSDATGHLHGVRGVASIWKGPSQHRDFGMVHYLVVEGPAMMALHLEHKDRPLPVGCMEVRPQREEMDGAWRTVMD